jgi:hypothetical protein
MLFTAQRRCGRLWWPAVLAFGLTFAAGSVVAGETAQDVSPSDASPGQLAESPTPIDFDIPEQPLARALMAYGALTGLGVYYNAAVAQGRVSAEVKGEFTPTVALRMLLQGSGLVPRMTGPGDFTVVLAPRPTSATATKAVALAGNAYEPYFAAIQRQIAEALCRTSGNGLTNDGAIFRIWLDASGMIARADILEAGGDADGGQALESAVQGLSVGRPPTDMPQPVTLAIFPPSPAAQICLPHGAN